MAHSESQILSLLDDSLAGGVTPEEAPARDRLTGMLSREALLARLEQSLIRAAAQPRNGFALLLLDLDRFKLVNHAYGHEAGDLLLRQVADRIRMTSRATDAVLPATRGNAAARLGGDEFVVVCEEVDASSAVALGRRLQAAIRLPLTVGGVRHVLSASIGIALGHTDPDTLLGNADAAVYRAKAGGGARVELFPERSGGRRD